MNAPNIARILFVDDEPMILELLKLTLAPMSGEWDMGFAPSGDVALAWMAKRPYDIVVSDMRMPGMSGAQLLNEVMKRYPATVRIIFSGYAEQEQVLKCIGNTHQFLAKPFDVGALKAALNRCQNSKTRLPNAEIQALLARRDHLPSIPAVYFQIIDALQAPDCSAQRIGEIVATDPGLTAKILQLVNSAFFGFAREISNAEEAVMLLGVGTIRALALTVHLFSAFEPMKSSDWSVEQISNHSLRVGRLARKIAEFENAEEGLREEAFTAGLLHDAGKLILADNLAARYLELHTRARAQDRPLSVVEREALGVTHAEVGAYLLDLWGLPASLVEAVALHHEPGKTHEPAFSSLTAVHVANGLAETGRASDPEAVSRKLDLQYLDQLRLRDRLETWREKLSGFWA
jgi:HD-like signal output (HDOD) protein/CheY-like chemotaxis protein